MVHFAGQAFVHRNAIDVYVAMIERAAMLCFAVPEARADFAELVAIARADLASIEAGDGKIVEMATVHKVAEERLSPYRQKFPIPVTGAGPLPDVIGRDEIVAAEREMVAGMEEALARIDRLIDDRETLSVLRTVVASRTASRPTAAWLRKAKATMMTPDFADLALARIAAYQPGRSTYNFYDVLYERPPSADFEEQEMIRGLVWALHLLPAERVGPLLVDLTMACFTTIPNIGIKAEKLGNAALWSLEHLAGGTGAPILPAFSRGPDIRRCASVSTRR